MTTWTGQLKIGTGPRTTARYWIVAACLFTSLVEAYQSCITNSDCSSSSHCCITGKCSIASLCLNGLKQYRDVCEQNYECGSRCCDHSEESGYPICKPRTECTRTCSLNSQCLSNSTSSCCSFGECISGIICEGNKVLGTSVTNRKSAESASDARTIDAKTTL